MLSPITSPVRCSIPMSVSEDESVCEVFALSDHNSYSQPVNVVPCLSCCDKNELIKSLCRKVTYVIGNEENKAQTRNTQDSDHHFLLEQN